MSNEDPGAYSATGIKPSTQSNAWARGLAGAALGAILALTVFGWVLNNDLYVWLVSGIAVGAGCLAARRQWSIHMGISCAFIAVLTTLLGYGILDLRDGLSASDVIRSTHRMSALWILFYVLAAAGAILLGRGRTRSETSQLGPRSLLHFFVNLLMFVVISALFIIRLCAGMPEPVTTQAAVGQDMPATNLSDSVAMLDLGRRYEAGDGVQKNEKEAAAWYRKSAEMGNARGMARLGSCYLRGIGVEKDWSAGLKWCQKAAELGDPDGTYGVGICYMNGWGLEKDRRQALDFYRAAAEKGQSEAMCDIGFCYLNGVGIDKDVAAALTWYRKAANIGSPVAMANLGACYFAGLGVEKDDKEGLRWTRKAADLGNTQAMLNLAACYAKGRAVEKDERESAKWLRRAAELGDEKAKQILNAPSQGQ